MQWQPKLCQETGSQGRSLSKQEKGEEGVHERLAHVVPKAVFGITCEPGLNLLFAAELVQQGKKLTS